jgi:site-specific DNA recombinase
VSPLVKPLLVAIYARLSLTTEASVSIARQIAACETFAAERGWTVVLRATDDGVSASKVRPEDRPGWRQVAAMFDRIDVVLYWKTDRLARRVLDFYRLAEATKANGVAIVSATEPMLDLSTAQGRAFAGMLAIFAEMEADAISVRATAARGYLLREGRAAGGERPWPFEAVARESGPGMVWRAIPERAEAIRTAAADLIAGETSIAAVGRAWDAAGLVPKDGGPRWDGRSLGRLLSNPAIYGATVYRGDLIRNDDGSVRILAERVILDRATYRALQAVLAVRGANKSTPRTPNLPLLHGIAVCDNCGKRLQSHRPAETRDGDRRIRRYYCKGPRVGCSAPVSIAMTQLDAYVIEDFLTAYGRLPVTELIEEMPAVDPEAVAEIEDALDDLQNRLDATDDDDEAVKLIRRRKGLRAQLAELQDLTGVGPVAHWVETGESFAEIWHATDDGDTATRRALLARAYGEIRVKKGRPGRHGLDTSRLVIVPPEAMPGYGPGDAD